MKIQFMCRECFWKNVESYNDIQITDDNFYTYKCKNEHHNFFIVQNEKFELLTESAVYAILDGYYREAVSSMTSSLERLYEFTVKIILKKHNLSDKILEKIWKEVSNQSERQFGAFLFLYALEFNDIPESLTEKERNFRNSVIHKGKFPSCEETIVYNQRILDIIFKILEKLRAKCEETIEEMFEERNKQMFAKAEKLNEDPFPVLTRNVLNLYHHLSGFEKPNLLEYLKFKKEDIN